jgi:tetratricopeptide (TPR) repeat protein
MWSKCAAIAFVFALSACAARVPPAVPTTLRYPEFVYPAVPEAMRRHAAAEHVEFGWRYLQGDDLGNAEREFTAAIKRAPALYAAEAGGAYVALARREYEKAIGHFDAALSREPKYVPALVGRGQALLALKRETEAVAAFEAALAVDPSLADVRRRVDVLRFRSAQEVVEAARSAAAAGRLEEARAAYRRALETSPESAFLHRELGIVERRRGDSEAAFVELRKAIELDASDAASLVQIGELLEQRLDYAGAAEAYRSAAELEPSEALSKRIEDVLEKDRVSKLPPEFRAIAESPQITRGELAALIGVHLAELLDDVPPRQVVVTDARSHWAAPWIDRVARAGILEPFPNHTFQPRARISRGELAAAVSRLALFAAREDADRRETWTKARPKIADMSPGHLSYPAVAVAVASGVMPLLEGERFAVTRPVSGLEAIDVVERVVALRPESR